MPNYIVGMEDVVGALGGFRGVRAELLVALRKAQPLTAHELGEQFGLTANALRRHLKALEEDGLVRYERDVRGVGAPGVRLLSDHGRGSAVSAVVRPGAGHGFGIRISVSAKFRHEGARILAQKRS